MNKLIFNNKLIGKCKIFIINKSKSKYKIMIYHNQTQQLQIYQIY